MKARPSPTFVKETQFVCNTAVIYQHALLCLLHVISFSFYQLASIVELLDVQL